VVDDLVRSKIEVQISKVSTVGKTLRFLFAQPDRAFRAPEIISEVEPTVATASTRPSNPCSSRRAPMCNFTNDWSRYA
jgi:hypothetical protein